MFYLFCNKICEISPGHSNDLEIHTLSLTVVLKGDPNKIYETAYLSLSGTYHVVQCHTILWSNDTDGK